MTVTALKYGESVYPEKYIFAGGRGDALLPISFIIYLIESGGRRVLVDAGCDDGAGFVMSVFRRPHEVLLSCGTEPGEITDLVITHSHLDHAGAAWRYPNATVHIHEAEYPDAERFLAPGARVHTFTEPFTLTEGVRVIPVCGHSAGSSVVEAGRAVLCGDECYSTRCLTEGILTGSTVNEANSRRFLEEYSTGFIPLLSHDCNILPGETGRKEYAV